VPTPLTLDALLAYRLQFESLPNVRFNDGGVLDASDAARGVAQLFEPRCPG
jgi:hypothetical protein